MQDIDWEKLLTRVTKPARYLGTEWNAIHKDWEENPARMVFVYPDLYEVGMSHLGLAILYGAVNERPGMLMERAFAPGPDLEALLREEHLPLFSLESHRPLTDFDVLGFTLQYEMSYTTILNILDLAGIPLKASERTPEHPLIIGGGPGAANPEPVAPFFDAFLLGDGEEALPELLALVDRLKKEGAINDRRRVLKVIANLPGFYVPSLYKVEYNSDGTVAAVVPREEGVPQRISKRVIPDLDEAYFPTRPIVPFLEVIHDRMMLEVMRGCTHGCRFCQAGAIYRPVRERDLSILLRQAEELVRHTGHEEISLTSLSTADYSRVEELARALAATYADQGVSVSLPSLRVDAFSVRLAEAVQRVRKSTLTFAPEAGSQRLRDVINKGVNEEDILTATGEAFRAGWQAIKLYFMLGLPTEREEDLLGIVDLARRILDQGRKLAPGGKPTVTVSVSSFVPKPWTAFQWEPQDRVEVIKEKQKLLRSHLRGPGLRFNWHEAEVSFIEAVLSRGDRRLSKAIVAAWRRGARLEGWSEYFNYGCWEAAFRETGLDPAFYACRLRREDEVFPWDHLDFGIAKDFLQRERRRAYEGRVTVDCRSGRCTGCGVCPGLGVDLILKGGPRDSAVTGKI
ncbi:Radical SAM, alpha/beta horseshoe [Moorella glycerini]|uniref:Radical SAM superfamily protein n=1 Tax=Neomoorella stamsii TaxID=1266720 RepID=A0A9X7J4U2_9FIRM|nr:MULTISPECIES: TIGR03960 family B12-binding radical SAM protein [Moorella]PRR76388.1 Radical SAM superfamily protein [Moorella stamsii]CEP67043.1 Radical SAM, alpha/beta horseshoe [Moorella glycerini]